jgi:hypothetical protein
LEVVVGREHLLLLPLVISIPTLTSNSNSSNIMLLQPTPKASHPYSSWPPTHMPPQQLPPSPLSLASSHTLTLTKVTKWCNPLFDPDSPPKAPSLLLLWVEVGVHIVVDTSITLLLYLFLYFIITTTNSSKMGVVMGVVMY